MRPVGLCEQTIVPAIAQTIANGYVGAGRRRSREWKARLKTEPFDEIVQAHYTLGAYAFLVQVDLRQSVRIEIRTKDGLISEAHALPWTGLAGTDQPTIHVTLPLGECTVSVQTMGGARGVVEVDVPPQPEKIETISVRVSS